MATEPAFPPALRFELRVALKPHADGLRAQWQADLIGPAADDRLHFASMAALLSYLERLDAHVTPMRGIR